MSYIDRNLMEDEKIIFRTRPHWIIFSNAILWAIIMLGVYAFGPYTQTGQWNIYQYKLYNVVGTVAFLVMSYSTLLSYIQYTCSEFGVTNKRVLVKLGFIRRSSLEVLLPKVESILIEQTMGGRMLNYGTIIICGTGGSRDAFQTMPDPMMFRKIVQEQVELYEDTHRGHPG